MSGAVPDPAGLLAARLAARVAHDLNNALAIFSGHIYLLRDGAEPLEEGLDAMEKAAENVERLAKSLTALGSIGIEPPGPVDVNRIVQTAVARRPAGSVEADLGSDVPAIHARGADVESAVRALLDNAFEATAAAAVAAAGPAAAAAAGPGRPAGPSARVSTTADAEGISIVVEDWAGGIPAEVRRRRFDPLFSTKGERGRGIGITLATAAAVVAGGSLEIEDRSPGGTRAILRLPKTSPSPSPKIQKETS